MDEKIAKVITRVKRIGNLDLTGIDDGALEQYAEDALVFAKKDGFDDSSIVIGASWLAAHYIHVSTNTDSNVHSNKADVLEQSFFDRFGKSEYLEQYNQLKKSLLGTSQVNFY